MKVTFLTNQASYHQMHYARAMIKQLGEENFRIVFQRPTSDARAEMGWQDDYKEPYIIRLWQSAKAEQEVVNWIEHSDVVIQGRFPISYVRARIKARKLTFACQERLWKKVPTKLRMVSRFPHLYKNYYSVNKPNYHFFAIGAHAASDLNNLGLFAKRSWRFGYFIDAPRYQPRHSPGDQLKLLWCARMSAVKQPSIALDIVEGLNKRGVNAELTMIGDGELRREIDEQLHARSIGNVVRLVGWQSQDAVFDYMQGSDLFLMTSHHGEGWGMVVNEAMSHGCAVLANRKLGSAECLIEDGASGFLYEDESLEQALDRIAKSSLSELREIGQAAHRILSEVWSASAAAERSMRLFDLLLAGEQTQARLEFTEGPCSSIV